jgi:hypothetical protein
MVFDFIIGIKFIVFVFLMMIIMTTTIIVVVVVVKIIVYYISNCSHNYDNNGNCDDDKCHRDIEASSV